MSLEKFNHYLIQKGQNENLSEINAAPWEDIPLTKEVAMEELNSLRSRLTDLQRRFFVDQSKKLLIILQGMDTSGKNSTIRHVFLGQPRRLSNVRQNFRLAWGPIGCSRLRHCPSPRV